MKKGILPVALFLAMALGQSTVYADGGHYTPRAKAQQSQETMIGAMRANQKTGLIDPALMIAAQRQAEATNRAEGDLYWVTMGPNNIGGQTTAVIYDNQNPSVAYIGSKGGGVYKTYNKGVTWHSVGNAQLMVSSMVQDANGIIYVGTGDCGTAYKFNGMNEMGYQNSFIGTGIYKIEDDVVTQIASTNPTALNQVEDWSFVNSLAITDGKLIAATNAGLRYTTDGGNTWKYAKTTTGEDMTMTIDMVRASTDGTIVVSAKEKQGSSDIAVVYIGTLDAMQRNTGIDNYPTGLFDVAIVESNSNIIYAAAIDNGGMSNGIYMTEDKGETWQTILPMSDYVQVYEGFGTNNHGIHILPDDPYAFFVTGYNLWIVRRYSEDGGYFIANKLSDGTQTTIFNGLHVGLHALAFNPNNSNEFYIGTDGGIFKGTHQVQSTQESVNITNCNRNYTTSRFFSLAYSASKKRVVGGCLDHGSVLVRGLEENANELAGEQVYPNMQFMFNSNYYAGYCALSLLNPDALFVTTVGSSISRSQTMGADYDMSNFNSNLSISTAQQRFRMPIAFSEKFDDNKNGDSVWFYTHSTPVEQGTVVKCRSNIADYPFDFTVPYDMPENDSILVHDPFSAMLVLGVQNYIYMTRTPLHFSKLAEWPVIARTSTGFSGIPVSMTLSQDQDVVFVGTYNGGLYRISNLNNAYDEYADVANYKVDENGNQITEITFDSVFVPDTTWIQVPDTVWTTIWDEDLQQDIPVVDSINMITEIDTIVQVFADNIAEVPYFAPTTSRIYFIDAQGDTITQCVTSIAVNPNDANKVVVTLGNYGNTSYVMYSDNALSDQPVFSVKQGNLPLMPIYSSVIEMTTGKVILGTEHGIYMTDDIAASSPTWTAQRNPMGDVPVMELKQQIVDLPTQKFIEFGKEVIVEGTDNQGVIYAATYGKGLYRCDNFILNSPVNVEEVASTELNMSVYPNPASDYTKVSFELDKQAYVTYQIYDITGRKMQDVVVGNCQTGKHEVSIKLGNMATGTYLLKLNQGEKSSVAKFLVY